MLLLARLRCCGQGVAQNLTGQPIHQDKKSLVDRLQSIVGQKQLRTSIRACMKLQESKRMQVFWCCPLWVPEGELSIQTPFTLCTGASHRKQPHVGGLPFYAWGCMKQAPLYHVLLGIFEEIVSQERFELLQGAHAMCRETINLEKLHT